jgi:hypothetical protein
MDVAQDFPPSLEQLVHVFILHARDLREVVRLQKLKMLPQYSALPLAKLNLSL